MELKARVEAAMAVSIAIRQTLKHNLERTAALAAKHRETLAEFVKLCTQPVLGTGTVRVAKKKHQAPLRLVVSNDLPAGSGRDPPRARRRNLKVRSKLLDMTDARILDLSTSDLLDGSLGDPAAGGHFAPAPLRGLEMRQNGLVQGAHSAEGSPVFGFTQPNNGVDGAVRWLGMPRPRTPTSPTSPAMGHFIENVEALLPVSFPLDSVATDRIEALAKRSGVGKETIRRALKGDAKSRVDTLEKVSSALGAALAQMMTPGYGALRAREQLASARQEPMPTRRQAGPALGR